MTEYIPGVCNIGPEEVKGRVAAGWVGLIVTVLLGAVLWYLHASSWSQLILFFPALIGALGFLQAGFHFCVAFGTQGVFNVSEAVGKTESVSQQEFRKKDQQKSVMIIAYSVLIALAVALLAAFYL